METPSALCCPAMSWSVVSSQLMSLYWVKAPAPMGSEPVRMASPVALVWPSRRSSGLSRMWAPRPPGSSLGWMGLPSAWGLGIMALMAAWSLSLAATQARVSFLPASWTVGI